ncbi:Mini-ribonuclease 3 [Athalassotoga saccharophila]|uniref:Mini-ribonuclease 3 n=1 Tax=Athalassotoga saccharophila TaxID=1441386 RepID=UPI001379646B|nr:ribonuclease III domain-containing protein [Athalassotoga saccharophila]BBJ28229.1 mini-ribonuclease III [Athalassotoga saccharophila]
MKAFGIEFKKDLREISTKDLAYIGDAVFELYCRLSFSFDSKTVKAHVNAKSQAIKYDFIEPFLHEDEKEIAMRGRNLKSPRSKDPSYRKATALESVIGYLFLAGRSERLEEILSLSLKI